MTTSLPRSAAALCAIAFAAADARPASGAEVRPPSIARLLPDRTVALVMLENASRTLDDLSETGLGRLIADPEFRAFAEPMRAHIAKLVGDAAANLRVALADVLPLLKGQMALAVLRAPKRDGVPEVFPDLVLTLEISDADAAARVMGFAALALDSRDVKSRTWDEGDVRFMHVPMPRAPFEGNMALAGHRLIVTVSPDAKLIRGMLAASIGAGDEFVLARDADFLKAVERAGDRRDLFVYFHVGRLAETLFELARLNTPPEEFMKARLVFEALGLDGVRSLSLSAAIDPPGFRTGLFVHAPAPRKGIFTLLSDEPMRSSLLRSAPRGARGMAAWGVRPDRVPGLLREVVSAVGPDEAARAEGPLAALAAQLARLGDVGRDGVFFVERAGVEPVVELSSVVIAVRTGDRAGVEPLFRLLSGVASVAVTGRGFAVHEQTTPAGCILRTVPLPLGFSPTIALSDDYIIAAPTKEAALRALPRLAMRGGADAFANEPLTDTPACVEATARVGQPTFLYMYRRAWRAEDYAPIMAFVPALAGVAYGVAFRADAPPEVLEFLGKINLPAMPSPELLARHSIPSVVAGRADADGVSVTGWGPGLYPGGLASLESLAIVAAPLAVVGMYEKRTGPAAIEDVFQGQRPGAKQGTDEPDNDAEAFDVEW